MKMRWIKILLRKLQGLYAKCLNGHLECRRENL